MCDPWELLALDCCNGKRALPPDCRAKEAGILRLPACFLGFQRVWLSCPRLVIGEGAIRAVHEDQDDHVSSGRTELALSFVRDESEGGKLGILVIADGAGNWIRRESGGCISRGGVDRK